MKKVLPAITALLLCAVLGGCVNSTVPPSSASSSINAASSSEQPSVAPDPPEPSTDDEVPKQAKATDISIDYVENGNVVTLGYYDLYYRFYLNAQKSGILVSSWKHPSEINGNYLLNFFVAQSHWNQTTYDSDIKYLPQETVEDYLKMYFDMDAAQTRQSKMYYEPETKAYLLPMFPQEDYSSIITNATISGNILTIYYETYNSFKENNPVSRQGHVTIELKAHLKIWKYLSNEITYDSFASEQVASSSSEPENPYKEYEKYISPLKYQIGATSWDSLEGIEPDALAVFYVSLSAIGERESITSGPVDDQYGNFLMPADDVEQRVQKYFTFDVPKEYIQKSQYYDAKSNAYWTGGIGSTVDLAILDVATQGDLTMITYEGSFPPPTPKFVASVTLKITEDGFQYVSLEKIEEGQAASSGKAQ